ncbi:hypothetical protein [Salipiger mangrovisoli]|uniref:Transposase n=1 Tax=Salipiger mangrovisoli TaxID=2865933 RepID=A0ABR9X7X7_9RHOB|nr:hypothetical protein [Salipiger mangrovisoli]MBE9639562.1 hypothetical protein [Salipiger mangrovisoli]
MAGKRRNSSAEPKATATLGAIRGELVAKQGLLPTLINTWQRQAPEGMSAFFSGRVEGQAAWKAGEIEKLRARIGRLVVERGFPARGER